MTDPTTRDAARAQQIARWFPPRACDCTLMEHRCAACAPLAEAVEQALAEVRAEATPQRNTPSLQGVDSYRVVSGRGQTDQLGRDSLAEGLIAERRRANALEAALAETRVETQKPYEALNWLVHLCTNVGRAGGVPEPGEWEAAEEAGRLALSQPNAEAQP